MADFSDYSQEYAECYELITQHKSYVQEVDALVSFLDAYDSGKILSVGSGIGLHECYLAKKGFKVFGIDKSEWMVNLALSRSKGVPGLSFGTSYKSAEQHFGLPCGCVISLFNVINCLPDLASLCRFFEEVFEALDSGGVFLFEAWNGVECMINPPKIVVRDFTGLNGSYLNRKARPKLDLSRQQLQIEYEISGCIEGRPVATNSVHAIRLFTINEITHILSIAGFKCAQVYSSLPDLEPFDFNSPNPPRMLAFTALA